MLLLLLFLNCYLQLKLIKKNFIFLLKIVWNTQIKKIKIHGSSSVWSKIQDNFLLLYVFEIGNERLCIKKNKKRK